MHLDSGGYMVQPVPEPPPTNSLDSISHHAGTSSQNEEAFSRPSLRSSAPTMSGSIQLPNPPSLTGMTNRKIIVSAWVVSSV